MIHCGCLFIIRSILLLHLYRERKPIKINISQNSLNKILNLTESTARLEPWPLLIFEISIDIIICAGLDHQTAAKTFILHKLDCSIAFPEYNHLLVENKVYTGGSGTSFIANFCREKLYKLIETTQTRRGFATKVDSNAQLDSNIILREQFCNTNKAL